MRFFRLLPILISVACGEVVHKSPALEQEGPAEPAPTVSRAERLASLPLSYETLKTEVLPKCATQCHKASAMVDLQDFAGVSSNISDVKSSVFGSGMPMPPRNKPQLSNCEKALLKLWIEAGTPEKNETLVGHLEECLVH